MIYTTFNNQAAISGSEYPSVGVGFLSMLVVDQDHTCNREEPRL